VSLKQIAPDSKEFLIWLFTGLRNDLANRARSEGQGSPDPDKAARDLAIFDALLTGLEQGKASDDEAVRRYVAELARATDEENEYERVEREHRALTELSDAFARLTIKSTRHQDRGSVPPAAHRGSPAALPGRLDPEAFSQDA
jgi:hypothetical protein